MKVLLAGIATESNSFSPIPTGKASFEESFVSRRATEESANLFSAPLHEWRAMAEARGWSVEESLMAFAQPAGPTVRGVYEGYRDEILGDIDAHRPDILLLSMHGAMIAEGYDDCEGDLAMRARAILGDAAIIGMELDPHHHLTDDMMAATDAIVAYKEHPHTDSRARARELFDIVADAAEGRIEPVMRDYDCRMIARYQTSFEPMRGFVDAMMAREGKDNILSISMTHGFPFGDSPRVGTRMLAITDGDADKALEVARSFGERLWSLRDRFRADYPTIRDALDRVEKGTSFPFVLADFADNAGGGAPSDSTFVLKEVLARGMRDVALGIFWDPLLVRMCSEAGVGSTMDVRIGGKLGKSSGDPVDLRVAVRAIGQDMSQALGDSLMPMGNAVRLEAERVHLVVGDLRTQTLHPTAFTDLGIDPGAMKAFVVKSAQHFHAGFAPIASEVIQMKGPGAITPDFTAIPFTKRDGNYWPRVDNPWT